MRSKIIKNINQYSTSFNRRWFD